MSANFPLSSGGVTFAVLDANVLLPPRLSDILFDLFLEGLYLPRWTKDIEREFLKNFGQVVMAKSKAHSKALKDVAPSAEHMAGAQRRLDCFRSAVGVEHEVLLHDTPAYRKIVPKEVDAGDVHVASAALVLRDHFCADGKNNKVFIVTNNLAHLAVAEMEALGVGVVSPGSFIDALNAAAPAAVAKALRRTTSDLQAPPLTKSDLLALLELHGAKGTADYYAKKWQGKSARGGGV